MTRGNLGFYKPLQLSSLPFPSLLPSFLPSFSPSLCLLSLPLSLPAPFLPLSVFGLRLSTAEPSWPRSRPDPAPVVLYGELMSAGWTEARGPSAANELAGRTKPCSSPGPTLLSLIGAQKALGPGEEQKSSKFACLP